MSTELRKSIMIEEKTKQQEAWRDQDLWDEWAEIFLTPDDYHPETKKEVDFLEKFVLGNNRDQKILDAACGFGRHVIELRKRGFNVTGLDYSRKMLNRARKNAASAGILAEFVQGDMKDLPYHEAFDAVLNLGQSFGYFARYEEHQMALDSFAQSLKPNGTLLLDLRNPEYIFSRMRETGGNAIFPEHDNPRGIPVTIREFANEKQGLFVITFEWEKGAKKQRYVLPVHLFNFEELQPMLARAGFTVEHAWGNYNGGEFENTTSPRLTILARKGK